MSDVYLVQSLNEGVVFCNEIHLILIILMIYFITMKEAKIFFIILVFAMMSAVSAADNTTMDNVAAEDSDILDSQVEDTARDINVTFKEQMWEQNLSDISVELPENASGEFCVKIDDEVLYNQTIVEKTFKIPIKLPKRDYELYISVYPPVDAKIYRISAFYNDIELNITDYLKVMRTSPDFNYFHIPEEILYGEKDPIRITMPRSSNGILEVYLDDELINRTQARTMIFLNPPKMEPGNHTLRIIYFNDTYYSDYNNTFNFLVTKSVISIPKTLNIGHDDCISVETQRGTEGSVEVYLDSKLISTGKLEYGGYILSLEKYLKTDSSQVTVKVKTKDFTRTKTRPITVVYDFDIYAYSLVYGDKNTIEVMLPDTLNNNLLHVKIDGQPYRFKRQDLVNNAIEMDISGLNAGNHSMFISYDGDARFRAQNKTYNFTIDYRINTPYHVTYNEGSKVFLKLPEDAKGNLVVLIDGKSFASSGFGKGYAEVKLDTLAPGHYRIDAFYDGGDYNVTSYKSYVYVSAKTTITYTFTRGETAYITVEVPKTTSGYVEITIDGKSHKANIKNGVAKYSLENLKVGEYEVEIGYYGSDDYYDYLDWAEITVTKPKIKYLSCEVSFDGLYLKMKVLTKKGKVLAGKKIKVKFNGKTYTIKTNKKGIATLKKSYKLKNKKYTLKIDYMGVKITKKVKVKPLSLKTKVVKKKVVIKASINKKVRGKTVKFKVNGKTIKAKTNSKGVAKITVKKSKTMKIKAAYKKSTVCETVEGA